MVIRLGGFGGLSEVHRCLSCFHAHLSICEDGVRRAWSLRLFYFNFQRGENYRFPVQIQGQRDGTTSVQTQNSSHALELSDDTDDRWWNTSEKGTRPVCNRVILAWTSQCQVVMETWF